MDPDWLANLYRRAEFFPSVTLVRDAMRPVETQLTPNSKKPVVLVADESVPFAVVVVPLVAHVTVIFGTGSPTASFTIATSGVA